LPSEAAVMPSVVRFAGVALSGAKADRTALTVLEYYPGPARLFLKHAHLKIQSKEDSTADSQLLNLIQEMGPELQLIGIDAPLSLPLCLNCGVQCESYETCTAEHNVWMRAAHLNQKKKKKRTKHYTPYTDRCVEYYVSHMLEEPFEMQHALGANNAPLAARATYLVPRLPCRVVEVFPQLSLWRIGLGLRLAKSHLRFFKHSPESSESRHVFLREISKQGSLFVYQQDLHRLIDSPQGFNSLICALTAFLSYHGQSEEKPKNFPSREGWVEFPRQSYVWPPPD